MDFIPLDKVRRNLLSISVEEHIPNDIETTDEITEMLRNSLKNRLMNASGCQEILASEVVSLWINAITNKDCPNTDKQSLALEDLYIKKRPRTYKKFKRNGIKNTEDLIRYYTDFNGFDDVEAMEDIVSNVKKIQSMGNGNNENLRILEELLNDNLEKAKEEIHNQLEIAKERVGAGDIQGAIEALKEAVILGYKGDYSIIGEAYLNGHTQIKKDITEAYFWLNRFYSD